MGKSKRGEREFGREKRLAHENKKLKQQVSQLRKMLARVDLDRYASVKETIEQHYQQEEAEEGQNILDKIRKEWACREPECGGFLEIFTYKRVDSIWYYRVCSNAPECKNRTIAQKYSPDVRGIMRKPKDSK